MEGREEGKEEAWEEGIAEEEEKEGWMLASSLANLKGFSKYIAFLD